VATRLLLARRSRHVYGIEVAPAAVADAVRNARENGIENCTFLPGEVRHVLPTLTRDGVRAEVLGGDPPGARARENGVGERAFPAGGGGPRPAAGAARGCRRGGCGGGPAAGRIPSQ